MSPDPNETRRLIEAIENTFTRRIVFRTAHDPLKLALWALHTHAIEYADITPYLSVSSAERESGKSTVRKLLGTIVANPWLTIAPTEAVLYRYITKRKPTLLLDEYDAVFKGPPEFYEGLRAMLNSGFERGDTVSRCVARGNQQDIEDFEVFCPKGLFGIGGLPDTVSSRCIHIRLQRKLPGARVERARRRDLFDDATTLREWCEAWRDFDALALEELVPELPDALSDRETDIWEPLLAIATLAGPEMVERAVTAALDRSGLVVTAESRGIKMLRSCLRAFGEDRRVLYVDLLSRLNDQDDEKWGSWNDGKGIAKANLFDILAQYEIVDEGKNVRPGPGVSPAKGFRREQFEQAWAQYLPAEYAAWCDGKCDESVTPQTRMAERCDDVTAFQGYRGEKLLTSGQVAVS
jgi:hypothetical protein